MSIILNLIFTIPVPFLSLLILQVAFQCLFLFNLKNSLLHLRAFMLATNSPVFLHLRLSLFCHSWRLISLDINFWLDISFSNFKNVPLPSAHCYPGSHKISAIIQYCLPNACNVSYFWGSFQDFLLVISFQQFDYDVSGHGFLHIFPV